MLFLIDENLPKAMSRVFEEHGFAAEHVTQLKELRGQPDEVIFDYAVGRSMVIITRDIRFASIVRFPLKKLKGIMLLRFPNEVTTDEMCQEVKRLTKELKEEDFEKINIVSPGWIRSRDL
jgi:predicted nuclease of predicted toxin-antitoxin system